MALAINGTPVHILHSFGSFTPDVASLTTTAAGCYIIVTCRAAGGTGADSITSIVGATLGAFTKISAGDYQELWACFATAALTSEAITITQPHSSDSVYDIFAVSGSNQTSLVWDPGSPVKGLNAPLSITTTNASTILISEFQASSLNPLPGGAHGPGFTGISYADALLSQYLVKTSAGTTSVTTEYDPFAYAGIVVAIPETAPVVTDICTGGVAFASGDSVGEAAVFLTDNTNSKWLTQVPAQLITGLYVRNQLSGGAQTVVSYQLTSGNDHPDRDPVGWMLEGSNNGTTWTTLHTVSKYSWLTRGQVATFNFTNSTAYAYYRWSCTELSAFDNTAGVYKFQLAEIRLWTGTNATGTNVAPGGTVTSSGDNGGDPIGNIFDNNDGSKWGSQPTNGSGWTVGAPIAWWFGYKFASAVQINAYTLTSGNDAPERDPQDWVFQYSDDNLTYTTVGTWIGEDFPSRIQKRTFYGFTLGGNHLYWRVYCTKRGDNATTGVMQLCEMEMGGGVATVTGYTLTAAAGSYALTGSAVTLPYVQSYAPVAPLLVGRGRTLKRPWLRNRLSPPPPPALNAYVLDTATAGSYALTGTAATLIKGKAIPPNPVFVPGHALLTNMLACYLPGVYNGVPVSGTGPTLANGAGGAGTVVSTIEGPALRSNTLGAAKGLTATAPSAFKAWTNFTILWRGVIIAAGDAFCPLLGVSSTDADVAPYFMVNVATTASGYTQLQAYYGDSSTAENTPALDVTGLYGSIIDVAVTVTVSGAVTFYVNGTSVGTNTMSVISTSNSTAKIVVNQGIDATSRSPNASCNMACFWDRTLSSGEVLGLHNDPYAFLQSGRIITAGAGAYALTGTAATLLRGREIDAATAGAYALTGTAAALLRGRKFDATTAGAYALTGTAAALLRGRRFDVTTAGAYALTGTAAALKRGRTVIAAAGAYTLTGSAATLIKSGIATQGAWDSNVSSATLSNGDRTAAGTFMFARSTDSHAASGAVNYYAEVKLDSTTAGYIVNIGITDASLTNQVFTDSNGALSDSTGFLGTFPSLVFAAGAVVGIAYAPATGKVWIRVNNGIWNGSGTANPSTNTGGISYASANPAFVFSSGNASNVTLTVNTGTVAFVNAPPSGFRQWWGPVAIAAGAGSYALTGTAAALLRGRKIAATTAGSYALTGTAATLRKGKVLIAGVGSYTLTGTAATLTKGKILIAGVGAYALTGTAATLRKGKILIAGAGAYALTGTAAAFLKGRLLAAGVSSYTLTGSAVTLIKLGGPRILVAGAGTYTLTGTAAALLRTRKLVADEVGDYFLSGSSASLGIGPWLLVGVGSTSQVTTTVTHTLSLPAGSSTGDLLIAVLSARIISSGAITLPSGGEWTLIGQQNNNNIITGTTGIPHGLMAYCVRGATAPNTTFTYPAVPNVALGAITAYRGQHAIAPFDVATFSTTATNVTAVSVAGLTTGYNDDLIVVAACGGGGGSWTNFDATDPSVASGSSSDIFRSPLRDAWLRRFSNATVSGADASIAIADAIRTTFGATGNITITSSVASGHVVLVAAFKSRYATAVLTAGAGAYALTGSPALLTAPHQIVADAGAYALTGSDVALVKRTPRILTAAAGAYALTGSAVTLIKRTPRVIVAGAGAYTTAGTSVFLLRGRKIAATTAGAYALTGSAVTLTRLTARTLAAAAGSYALTGASTTALTRKWIFVATTSGAYALTGDTATQLRKSAANIMLATSGIYSLTGTAVALKRGRLIKAGYETVTWDPATIASVVLSNGNLTATNTGTTSANQGARGKTWGLV